MPLYSYVCDNGHQVEEFWSIAQMEVVEATEMKCHTCGLPLRRNFAPRRHVVFHEDVYENIAHDPIHITSAQQLQNECRKHDVTSKYMQDQSTLFGAKLNLWV